VASTASRRPSGATTMNGRPGEGGIGCREIRSAEVTVAACTTSRPPPVWIEAASVNVAPPASFSLVTSPPMSRVTRGVRTTAADNHAVPFSIDSQLSGRCLPSAASVRSPCRRGTRPVRRPSVTRSTVSGRMMAMAVGRPRASHALRARCAACPSCVARLTATARARACCSAALARARCCSTTRARARCCSPTRADCRSAAPGRAAVLGARAGEGSGTSDPGAGWDRSWSGAAATAAEVRSTGWAATASPVGAPTARTVAHADPTSSFRAHRRFLAVVLMPACPPPAAHSVARGTARAGLPRRPSAGGARQGSGASTCVPERPNPPGHRV
jgi:hypothetical protein